MAYTIWATSDTPAVNADPETNSVEVGVRFSSQIDGWITAIRFFKGSANLGTHIGHLWSSSGGMLATTTFVRESVSGWQQADLSSPVRIRGGRTYVASYRAPRGRYADDPNSLSVARPKVTNALKAFQGVYTYGNGLPDATWQDSNYFVDVVLTTAASPPMASISSTPMPAGQSSAVSTPSPTPQASVSSSGTVPTGTEPAREPASSGQLSSGFPDGGSTGVLPSAVLRQSGSITVSTPGAVIEGMDIKGIVNITAPDVVLRNSRIKAAAWIVVKVKDGLSGVRIEDVEIDGSGLAGMPGSVGIAGPVSVLRADIHSVENGIIPSSGAVIRDSYIHDLDSPGSPHYDGIQMDGGQSGILIEHNAIDLTNHGWTSTIMMDNDFGAVTNVRIVGNQLIDGSYTIYADGKFSSAPINGIVIDRNQLGKGAYGYGLVRNASVSWTDNVDYLTTRVVNY
jgi:hypothetical protein